MKKGIIHDNNKSVQKIKAEKALELAKEVQASKKGKYVRLNNKIIVFKSC